MALFEKKVIVGTEQKTFERIRMLRFNILVHSVIYYKLNQNIITDEKFDSIVKELAILQKKHANISAQVKEYKKEFEKWDGLTSSCHKLPLNDKWANRKARYLLRVCK